MPKAWPFISWNSSTHVVNIYWVVLCAKHWARPCLYNRVQNWHVLCSLLVYTLVDFEKLPLSSSLMSWNAAEGEIVLCPPTLTAHSPVQLCKLEVILPSSAHCRHLGKLATSWFLNNVVDKIDRPGSQPMDDETKSGEATHSCCRWRYILQLNWSLGGSWIILNHHQAVSVMISKNE